MIYLLKNIALLFGIAALSLVPLCIILAVLYPFGLKLNKWGMNYRAVLIVLMLWGVIGGTVSWAVSKPYAKYIMQVKTITAAEQHPKLQSALRIVEEISKKAGLKNTPETGYYISKEINAFAIGTTQANAMVAISSGLLDTMDEEQLEGVIGHEISHIQQGDMVTMTVMQGVANATILFISNAITVFTNSNSTRGIANLTIEITEKSFGFCGLMIINYFSRSREYRADEGSARLAGKDKIINALKALQKSSRKDDYSQTPSLAAFKIAGDTTSFNKLLATHPPIEERIARIEKMTFPQKEDNIKNTEILNTQNIETEKQQINISTITEKQLKPQKQTLSTNKSIKTNKVLINKKEEKSESQISVSTLVALTNTYISQDKTQKSIVLAAILDTLPIPTIKVKDTLKNIFAHIYRIIISPFSIVIFFILFLSDKMGNKYASKILGDIYQKGTLFIKRNISKAISFYKKAIYRRNYTAALPLSVLLNNQGKKKEAIDVLEQAVIHAPKLRYIQKQLGNLYIGINDERAFINYKAEAEKGDTESMFKVGRMAEDGKGTEKNISFAIEMYEKAVEKGNADAQNSLGLACLEGKAKERNEKKAFELFQKSAKQGNEEGQINLANMYYEGVGTKQNYKKAFDWYSSAADQGNQVGTYMLGLMYYYGQGIGQDYSQAFKCFIKFTIEDLSVAQSYLGFLGTMEMLRSIYYNLGEMYYNEQGVEQDYSQALKYYIKAAKLGDPLACYNIGIMYENEQGVEQDYSQAIYWYLQAADWRHPSAIKKLIKYAENGDLYVQFNLGIFYSLHMQYEESAKWFRKVAKQKDSAAQYILGNMYYNGVGVKQDYSKAAKWFIKSAKQELSSFQKKLGIIENNHTENANWFRKAVEQGPIRAQVSLGLMYYDGQGVAQDYAEAVKWFQKAAEQGHASAQFNLGVMYDNGKGVKQSKAKAARWYYKAADQGYDEAQYSLGQMYEKGRGVEKDLAEARKWYELAAAQGHEEAKAALERLK